MDARTLTLLGRIASRIVRGLVSGSGLKPKQLEKRSMSARNKRVEEGTKQTWKFSTAPRGSVSACVIVFEVTWEADGKPDVDLHPIDAKE